MLFDVEKVQKIIDVEEWQRGLFEMPKDQEAKEEKSLILNEAAYLQQFNRMQEGHRV